MSRNNSKRLGFQLQAVAATSNLCSASSSSLSLRPCSLSSLNLGTLPMRFHSSALWSIRRKVRSAQLAFDAEPLKLNASTSSLLSDPGACPRFSSWKAGASHCSNTFLTSPRKLRFDPIQELNRELLQPGSLPIPKLGTSHRL
jgi:hypothetical protein